MTSDLFAPDDEFLSFDEDEELVFEVAEDDDSQDSLSDTWKALVVDDEIEVHQATRLALQRFTFQGKPLALISAYSGEEAKKIITENPDTAVILLDVVMENNDAGLTFAKYLRDVLDNQLVRVILRTGQPDDVPEESIIVDYDINDYKTKTELTRKKLFTTVVAALRSYHDLMIIESNRKELGVLNTSLEKRSIELEQTNQRLLEEIVERKKLEVVRFEKERLRLENEFLEKQSQELAKLNADKDKFFSIVSHDLRAPFNVLLGATKYMVDRLDDLTPDDVQVLISGVYNSAQTTFNLLENLLAWAKVQMGGMKFNPNRVDLYAQVSVSMEVLEEMASKKDITLRNLVASDMVVYADDNMLDTVIRNMISNALKFTPAGGSVTVSARSIGAAKAQLEPILIEAQAQDLSNQLAEMSISDTGVGISPEDIDKLFKFDTLYTTYGTAHEKGAGLGLIICKEMIEKHSGQIWVESEVGQGTTIKFTLPLIDSP